MKLNLAGGGAAAAARGGETGWLYLQPSSPSSPVQPSPGRALAK